jgi:uncharacterized protein YqhQ
MLISSLFRIGFFKRSALYAELNFVRKRPFLRGKLAINAVTGTKTLAEANSRADDSRSSGKDFHVADCNSFVISSTDVVANVCSSERVCYFIIRTIS